MTQVAFDAKLAQNPGAFLEAESCEEPALIIEYPHFIVHGVELTHNRPQHCLAVASGHRALLKSDLRRLDRRENPLHTGAKPADIPYGDFASSEAHLALCEQLPLLAVKKAVPPEKQPS